MMFKNLLQPSKKQKEYFEDFSAEDRARKRVNEKNMCHDERVILGEIERERRELLKEERRLIAERKRKEFYARNHLMNPQKQSRSYFR